MSEKASRSGRKPAVKELMENRVATEALHLMENKPVASGPVSQLLRKSARSGKTGAPAQDESSKSGSNQAPASSQNSQRVVYFDYQLRDWQKEALAALEGRRFGVIVAHRRAGKTEAVVYTSAGGRHAGQAGTSGTVFRLCGSLSQSGQGGGLGPPQVLRPPSTGFEDQ